MQVQGLTDCVAVLIDRPCTLTKCASRAARSRSRCAARGGRRRSSRRRRGCRARARARSPSATGHPPRPHAAAPALAASVSSSTSWLRGGLALGTAIVGGSVSGGLHAISGPDHLAALLPRCLGQRWWRAAPNRHGLGRRTRHLRHGDGAGALRPQRQNHRRRHERDRPILVALDGVRDRRITDCDRCVLALLSSRVRAIPPPHPLPERHASAARAWLACLAAQACLG